MCMDVGLLTASSADLGESVATSSVHAQNLLSMVFKLSTPAQMQALNR